MSKWTKEQLEEIMLDSVDSIYPYMTESRTKEYGENGYPLNELIDNVLGDIKKEVMLIVNENKALREKLGIDIDLDKYFYESNGSFASIKKAIDTAPF